MIAIKDKQSKQIEKSKIENNILRLVSDNVPGIIAYVELNDLRYKFVNKKFEETFGKTRNEVIGMQIREVIGEASYEYALKYIKEIREGRSCCFEQTYSLPQGTRWLKVDCVPDFNKGEVVGYVLLAQDITESKQAETERQKLVDNLQKALDEIKTLRGIVPICMHCKKIRDDDGDWNTLENHITQNTHAQLSHGFCPDCFENEKTALNKLKLKSS